MKDIIVAGDVALDWLSWEKRSENPVFRQTFCSNWRNYNGLQMHPRGGGALLLARMVEKAFETEKYHKTVKTYALKHPENVPPTKIIHSNTLFGEFPIEREGKSGEKIWRVKKYYGFSGPENDQIQPLLLQNDNPDANVIILDDAGNGFRNVKEAWPAAIKTPGKKPEIILKMSRPLADGELWDHLISDHSDRLIVIVNANDLRECGANISYRLSWERTAEDFFRQIQNNTSIQALKQCKTLIVRFGTDGAILYSKKSKLETVRLFYDPAVLEDGFSEKHPGKMQGLFCAFVAGFSKNYFSSTSPSINEAIEAGILASRNLIKSGFGPVNKIPDYYLDNVFNFEDQLNRIIARTDIPNFQDRPDQEKRQWTILETLTRSELEKISEEIVLLGKHPSLNPVPLGVFGGFKTIDRQEIESYQSIRNILQEYIRSSRGEPISIAVFGPPGSGKSFGVTQLAKTIEKERIEKVECNLSQFNDPNDLTIVFHKIRDFVLKGKIPLVFFDEFDSKLDGDLGWLKYFLAPMQDGEFKDGELMHPIGKAIFVFAGGTCDSLKQFHEGPQKTDMRQNQVSDPFKIVLPIQNLPDKTPEAENDSSGVNEIAQPDKKETYADKFRAAKGTDFISRLRGYINILGCNPVDDDDRNCILRRALLFRSILEQKAGHLIDDHGKAQIDQAIVGAFLRIPRFYHGVRSMQAILDMSMISDKKRFDQSDLPAMEQLKLHVNADMFMRLVLQEVLFQNSIEILAKEIHRQYLKTVKDSEENLPANLPWEELSEEYRESNREQARNIKIKLQEAKCWFRPKSQKGRKIYSFEQEDLVLLAKLEHIRWCKEKRKNGWRFGKTRNDTNRLHPDLVPWESLSPSSKKKDCDSVKNIPTIMANAGFEVYKLE